MQFQQLNNEKQEKEVEEDSWELHPLFLSKVPTKNDIDKNTALSALISIINEEEEKETFGYEPRRKNIKKKITERGEVILNSERRNIYDPYQSGNLHNIRRQRKKNADFVTRHNDIMNDMDEENKDVMNAESTNNNNDNDKNNSNEVGKTSIGELLVCMSMMNLK